MVHDGGTFTGMFKKGMEEEERFGDVKLVGDWEARQVETSPNKYQR